MNLLWILFPVAVSLSAVVYTDILTRPGMILGKWHEYLHTKLIGGIGKPHYRYQWLYKPLVGCVFCVSGQWALWLYLWVSLAEKWTVYHPLEHLFVVFATIYASGFLAYLYRITSK